MPALSTRSLIAAAALMLAATAAVATACGDGGADSSSTPEPTHPAASPTATLAASTPGAPKTGIDGIDRAIAAVLAEDADAVRSLVVYAPIACVAEQEGIGAPPLCLEGEADGTLVDALPVAQCEGYFVRPADIGAITIPTDGASLYGVYRREPDAGFPPGEYVVVFEAPPWYGDAAGTWAWALTMTDAGVTGIHHGCAQTPESFVEFQQLTDAVIPPSRP